MFKGSGKWQVASGKGGTRLALRVLLALCLMVGSGVVWGDAVRDPTRPPQAAPPANPAPVPVRRDHVLQSTRVAGELRSAVINGRVVSAGDRVDGALVVAVDVARVRLRDHHGEFAVRLVVPEIARPAQDARAPREASP